MQYYWKVCKKYFDFTKIIFYKILPSGRTKFVFCVYIYNNRTITYFKLNKPFSKLVRENKSVYKPYKITKITQEELDEFKVELL